MAVQTKSYPTIRDQILRDQQSLQPDTDISPDSDNYVRAAAVGATAEGLYQAVAKMERQIWPDTADEEGLIKHAAVRDIDPRAANAASSLVALTGQPGVTLLTGSRITHPTVALITTAEAVIDDDGNATVAVAAQTAGTAANGASGAVTLSSPPLGMDAQARLIAPLSGGTDAESQSELLQRYLEDVRNPQSGGNDADYERWAKAVPGVTTAKTLGMRRGGGTVDVVITSAGGIASEPLLAAVQAVFNARKPAGIDVWAITPALRAVDLTLRVERDGAVEWSDVDAAVATAVTTMLNALLPDERLVLSRIEAAVSSLPGVADVRVIIPSANVAPSDDPAAIGWIRAGRITVEPMA